MRLQRCLDLGFLFENSDNYVNTGDFTVTLCPLDLTSYYKQWAWENSLKNSISWAVQGRSKTPGLAGPGKCSWPRSRRWVGGTGCKERRKFTKQTNTQLVWWNRGTWEGKTLSPVTLAAPAGGGAALKPSEKLPATWWCPWGSEGWPLDSTEDKPHHCPFPLRVLTIRVCRMVSLFHLSLLPVAWQKALLLMWQGTGLG